MAIFLFFAAAAAIQTPVPPTPPTPAHPVTAELARQIAPDSFALGRYTPSITDIEKALQERMLTTHAAWRGPRCDPNYVECRAAAEQIAKRLAPAVAQRNRELAEDYAASVLGELTIPQQQAAVAFFNSEAGKAVAAKLPFVFYPLNDPKRAEAAFMRSQTANPDPTRGMIDAFYDATVSLPRAKPLSVPRPPISPSPPPQVEQRKP